MVGTAHIIFLSSLLFDLALAQSLSGSPLAASTSKPKIKTKTKTKTYGNSSSRKKGKVVHWDELSKGAKIAIFVIIGLVVASIAICVILGAMGKIRIKRQSKAPKDREALPSEMPTPYDLSPGQEKNPMTPTLSYVPTAHSQQPLTQHQGEAAGYFGNTPQMGQVEGQHVVR